MTPAQHPAPPARPVVDGKALREACGAFATGVTVVTAARPDEPDQAEGTTVNSFTSVSLDPPLVLFCLHRRSRLGPLLRDCGGFAINFLTHRQQDLAWAFSGRGRALVREVPHRQTPAGVPVLADALGFLVCRLAAEYDGGDHTIVLGEVVDLGAGAGHEAPLLFYRGAMRLLS